MSEMRPLGANALIVRRVRVLITAVVLAVISVAIVIVSGRGLDASLPWWPFVVVVVLVAALGWWWAGVIHSRWAWRLTDDLFEVAHGVLVKHTELVPRSRIQNVTTSSGPLQSRFGIVTLTVHTAGARTRNVSVEHIDVGLAESVRRRLGLT